MDMKKDLLKLQDMVYELEGLLQLAINREPCPDRILQLAKDKIQEIYLKKAMLETGETPAKAADDYEPLSMLEEGSLQEEASDDYPVEPEESCGEQTVAVAAPADTVTVSSTMSVVPKGRKKLYFCINDRFRFRRALFGNSDKLFNEAVEKITGFNSYDEAERYFLNEKGWDASQEDVADFLELLKIYFE